MYNVNASITSSENESLSQHVSVDNAAAHAEVIALIYCRMFDCSSFAFRLTDASTTTPELSV